MNNPVLNSESFDRAAHALGHELERFRNSGFDQSANAMAQAAGSIDVSVTRLGRLLGMQAENDQRKHRGESMAYDEAAFANA